MEQYKLKNYENRTSGLMNNGINETPIPTIHNMKLNQLVDIAKQDKDILAILIFGSVARGEQHNNSDIDICLMLMPQRQPYENIFMSRKRLEYLSKFDMDIHIYQQMPLYIKKRILKEGKVIFMRNENLLYHLAIKTIKEFEDYKHIYYDYLEEVAKGGS